MMVMSGVGSVKPTAGIPCQFCSKNSNGHCCTSSSSPQSSSPSLSPSFHSTPTQQQQKRRTSSSLRRNHNSYDRKSTSTPTRTTKKIIFGINIGNGEPCLNCLRMGDFCKAHENQRRKKNVMNGTVLSSSMSPRSVIIPPPPPPPPPPPFHHHDINSIHSSSSSSGSRKNDAKEIKRNNATSPRKQQHRQNKFSSPSSFSSSPKTIKISSEVGEDGRGKSNRYDDCKKNGGKEGARRRRTNHSQYHQKHHQTMMQQCCRPSIPNPPPFGLNNDDEEGEFSSTTSRNNATTTEAAAAAAVHSKKKEIIIKLKKEVTNLLNNCKNQTSSSFGKKDFAGSITKLTLGIQETMSCLCDDKFCSDNDNDVYNYYLELLVVLFSNRAAGLFGIGANRAVIDDCRQALDYLLINDNNNAGEDKIIKSTTTTTTRDSSSRRLDLQAILHNQMGRAFLKLGDTDAACQNFSCAIQAATIGLTSSSSTTKLFEDNNTNKKDEDDEGGQQQQQQKQLEKSIIAAKEGQELVSQLRFQLKQISDASNCCSSNSDDDDTQSQTDLQYIDEALKICDNFDTSLYFDKILLLVQDHRWHEVAYCCENIMSRNVLFDGCFILGDLSSKYPLHSKINNSNKNDYDNDDGGDNVPPPPPAKFLTSDFFQSDDGSRQKLLSNPEEVKEGILRLPDALIPYYLKALRLEKRFSAAQAALETLLEGDLSRFGSSVWKEQKILHLILSSFSTARKLYLKGDYAAAQICFEDCERFNNSDDNDEDKSLPSSAACNSGGRFNAMLRYNCAICAMKMMNFGEAINLCTSALTIHPLYMNAIKTRANCYSKLGQVTKAISDYRVWIRLTEQAKKDPSFVWEYRCRFNGPDQVTDDDVSESRKELKKLLTKQQREQEPQKNQYTHHRHRREEEEEEEREERGNRSSSLKRAETLSYNVLGLKLGASNTEIKKAYRILVLKHHPDKGGATEMFRKIQLAYETLSTNADY